MEAEGVGFEPTVGFPTLDFESSALNRTQPPFLIAVLSMVIHGPQLSGATPSLQRRSVTPALTRHSETWARDELACACEFDLTVLGGGCGTDQRGIEALAKQAVQGA